MNQHENVIHGPFNVPYRCAPSKSGNYWHLRPVERLQWVTIDVPRIKDDYYAQVYGEFAETGYLEGDDPPITYQLVERKKEKSPDVLVLSACNTVGFTREIKETLSYWELIGELPLPELPVQYTKTGKVKKTKTPCICSKCLEIARDYWEYKKLGESPFPFPVDKWHPTRSFIIDRIAVDDHYLIVHFRKEKGDGTYRYANSAHLFEGLGEAAELGKFFYKNVRPIPSQLLTENGWEERITKSHKELMAKGRKTAAANREKRKRLEAQGLIDHEAEARRYQRQYERETKKRMELKHSTRTWDSKQEGLIVTPEDFAK